MDDFNLDSVLNESEQPVTQEVPDPVAETPQEEPQAETKAPQRDEKGRFAPKGETEDAPPASDDKASKGLEAGIAAERKKRQEWETKYAELERKIAEMQQAQQPKEPPAPPPSVWEDDAAAFDYHKQDAVSAAVQQSAYLARLQTSELLMMQAEPEFVSVKQDVYEFVGSNPAINAEVQNSPHPWQTAFKAYKNHQTMQQLGTTDLGEIEAKLREKIMAEMQAQQPPQPALPRSLADAQSARGERTPAPQPLRLEDILGG